MHLSQHTSESVAIICCTCATCDSRWRKDCSSAEGSGCAMVVGLVGLVEVVVRVVGWRWGGASGCNNSAHYLIEVGRR